MRSSVLIYNPAAGRMSVKPFIPGVVKILSTNGWDVQVVETINGRHTSQLAAQAAKDEIDAVFAIGGDGTIGQVSGGLAGSKTALGVFPAGTSNVWANELGLKAFTWWRWQSLKETALLLSNSPVHAIDIGLCNQQPFLMWLGIGLDAMTVEKLEPRKRFFKYLSVPHYAAATIYNASIWHGMNLDIWVDDKKIEGHYLLAVASNIRRYLGGLTTLSPQALIDDGIMELWLFLGNNLVDAFRHFFAMTSGQHLVSEFARCIPFRNLIIRSSTPFSIQMDGEPVLAGNQVKVEILPGALQVIMPNVPNNYFS